MTGDQHVNDGKLEDPVVLVIETPPHRDFPCVGEEKVKIED